MRRRRKSGKIRQKREEEEDNGENEGEDRTNKKMRGSNEEGERRVSMEEQALALERS